MAAKFNRSRKCNHKKKAWKHVDLTEINEFLEDKELDERTGRTGKDLFTINTEGDYQNTGIDNKLIDEEERAIINNRPTTRSIVDSLKCFRHLGSTSAVPAFKPNKLNKKTPLETFRQKKRLQKVVKSLEKPEKKQKCKEDKDLKYDLWKEKEKTPIGDVYVDYAEDFEKVRLSRIFKCPPKRNSNVMKNNIPTLLPAVEEPHPGLSYNPDEKDHTELLISIGDKKKKEIKQKKKLNKKLKDGFDPTVNVALENAKEMASGLLSEDEENEEDYELNENKTNGETVNNKSVIASDLKKRKSNKAKKDKIRMRIDMLKAQKRKEKKKFESNFFKIKQYIKEAKTNEQKSNLRKQLKEQHKIEKLYKPARIGKEKYKDPEPEFCLKEELNGSLRKINTDGNLLMDRFKSLQRRNLIEHRRVQPKKRSKKLRKRVIKASIFNQDLFEADN